LYPTWQSREIVLESGAIGTARLLELGPVKWFWDEQSEQSGLVRTADDFERASIVFAGAADAGIAGLHRASEGVVTFDPTLSRALLLAEDQETLLEHLRKGGIWVIPILAFALFASTIAAIKAVWLYRLPKLEPAIGQRVAAAVREGGDAVDALLREVDGPQAVLVEAALDEARPEQRDDRLYSALLEQRNRLERWLGAIAMTASVSPLLGLLGTVSGMIVTFRLMTLFGAGDAATVSAGISEALVTTELGLIVAIPALLAHALMSRKVKSYLGQLENDAVQLSQIPARTEPA
jgi:biopolymer transport protein ExbB